MRSPFPLVFSIQHIRATQHAELSTQKFSQEFAIRVMRDAIGLPRVLPKAVHLVTLQKYETGT